MRDNKIQAVIDEYRKSGINSEAEVRSKFVVPLIEALGYPSELRAEEFPVYGYAGREKLHENGLKAANATLFDLIQRRSAVCCKRRKEFLYESLPIFLRNSPDPS